MTCALAQRTLPADFSTGKWKIQFFADELYKRKGQILFLSSFINQFYVLVMTTIMVAMMPILLLVGDGDVMRVVLSTLLSAGMKSTKSQ